jgi:lysostaphin
VTILGGETPKIRVKICQENGQLFYIGEMKQNPNQPIKIPALIVGKDKYQANNGSFSYLITPQKVEVWQNGNRLRSENF